MKPIQKSYLGPTKERQCYPVLPTVDVSGRIPGYDQVLSEALRLPGSLELTKEQALVFTAVALTMLVLPTYVASQTDLKEMSHHGPDGSGYGPDNLSSHSHLSLNVVGFENTMNGVTQALNLWEQIDRFVPDTPEAEVREASIIMGTKVDAKLTGGVSQLAGIKVDELMRGGGSVDQAWLMVRAMANHIYPDGKGSWYHIFKNETGQLVKEKVSPEIVAEQISLSRTTGRLLRSLASGSWEDESSAVPDQAQQIQATVEAVIQEQVDDMCGMTIDSNCGVKPPMSVSEAVESAMPQVVMGDPINPQIFRAVEEAVNNYRQTAEVIDLFTQTFDGEEIQVGYDFSELSPQEQQEAVRNILTQAENDGVPVQIEVGPGHVLSPCPAGSICVKVDLQSPTLPLLDQVPADSGQIAWFGNLDFTRLNNIPPQKEIFMVSPFPYTDGFESIQFVNLSGKAIDNLASNGTFTIVSNPKLQPEFEVLFSNLLAEQGNLRGGFSIDSTNSEISLVTFGDGSIAEIGLIESMRDRHPNISVLKDPRSLFIDEYNPTAKVLVFTKR